MRKKVWFALLVIISCVALLYSSHLILVNEFHYHGEAYYKGAGHLLQEDLVKGLLVLCTDQFIWSFLFSLILFYSLNSEIRTMAFKIICSIIGFIALLVCFNFEENLHHYSDNFHSFCRGLDYIITWCSRLVALVASYYLVGWLRNSSK